ncbi:DUF2112 family protein [Methanobrevibacter sp.]|uniref:DUF2112 family protein n=1 Tax=Methanobrevibacter sp. TaxID=66852 RepID=UPI003890E2F8
MNVIVVPDASMIVIPLIEKNGHTYLSPSNFSRYDNMGICEGEFSFDNLINRYASSELPSGIQGRLFLFSQVIRKADAAIILGRRPKNYTRMYNSLNDLILFGGNACNNAHSLEVKIVNDLDIPTLKLAFPKNKEQLIALIDKTNSFLQNLDGDSNPDDLGVDLKPRKDKLPVFDVKRILDKFI